MNIYISYFYNVRFFPQNLVPVSTAIYDPKWYHDFKGEKHRFVDKRGVINGLKITELSPAAVNEHDLCSPECDKDLSKCPFISSYKSHLDSLDFSKVMERLHYLADSTKSFLKLKEDVDVCLMVHEKPDNPCSERGPIVQYFKEHGVDVVEFTKPNKN